MSALMRCGAVIPVRPGEWSRLGTTARAIEEAGWDYAFSDEGPYSEGNDSVAAALYMATETERVQVGTSVAISYLRHPYNAASERISSASISKPQLVAPGLGRSTMHRSSSVTKHSPTSSP